MGMVLNVSLTLTGNDFDAQTPTDPKRDFPTRPPMKLDFQMLHVWKFSYIY